VWNASDEALVAGLSTGDADVALVFVRRFQSRVYGLALSITRDRSIAEEAAQDAFVRAWRYAASFDPRRGSARAESGVPLGTVKTRLRLAMHKLGDALREMAP
jgi:DNA-directed RNA polymerase specialized sigma24 family protein